MRRLTIFLLLSFLGLGVPRVARAQGNTAEVLQQAIGLYEDLQVERALTLLRQVISPSSPFEVTREQRVQAYKYLGAALAILGMRDSATVYFRAALERDPFTDLDAATFTAVEREIFAGARRLTFAVGARGVRESRFDPRTEHTTFVVISTHPARMRAELRPASGGAPVVILDHETDGIRELPWDGVLADGRLAPPGRYQLLVTATSASSGATDSIRVFFDVAHDAPAMEDTLPALAPADLLPEHRPRSVGRDDLLTGLGVATVTLAIPTVVGSSELGGNSFVRGAAGVSALAGLGAFLVRERHREIPANVAENARRRAERARENAEIAARNRDRTAETKLIIAPAAGLLP